MKSRRLLLLACLLGCAAIAFWAFRPAGKGERIAGFLSSANHKNIEFYGKVVDQFGIPIPDVRVFASVIFNTGLSSGVVERQTTTDSQGLFSFTGLKGRTFDYHLEKPGYQTMPEGDAFDYTELVPEESRHHPDPNNPVILKMWKLQGAEPMVYHSQRFFRLPADGKAVHIGLLTGKVASDGGLKISLVHERYQPGQQPRRFPWRAEISVPGGGLVPSTARLMYQAPEEGYDTVVLEQTGKDPGYDSGIDCHYYFKTKDGCFGRLFLQLNCDPTAGHSSDVMLTWWLNPKPGSRNLEFDPEKVVNPKP